MARKPRDRSAGAGTGDESPEARLNAKLKAMFEAIARARTPPLLTDLDALPRSRRGDRRS